MTRSPDSRPVMRKVPAFSLVEVVIAIAIMSILLTASLTAVGSAARDRGVQSEMSLGNALAASLLSEIRSQRFADPTGAPPPALASRDRLGFNDVMDYDGYVERPPKSRDGREIENASGWTRRVALRRVVLDISTGALAAPTGNSRADAIEIFVEARSSGGKVYAHRGYRTAFGMTDQPTPDTGVFDTATVRIGVGSETRAIAVGLQNQPNQ